MEVGVHNATLAIAVAMSPQLLGNPEMAMPSILYGALTYVTASLFGLILGPRAVRNGMSVTGAVNEHAIERR
jgi:bile acid:Na+ symporter, BASS family